MVHSFLLTLLEILLAIALAAPAALDLPTVSRSFKFNDLAGTFTRVSYRVFARPSSETIVLLSCYLTIVQFPPDLVI